MTQPETHKHPFQYTEASVLTLLRKHRYPEASCAVLPQVANATGTTATRTADAIVMQLWPSRGLTLEGLEIKVSRSDWLRELAQPDKADAIFQFCDKWYIAAPTGVVDLKKDDFPKTWGLLEIQQTQDHLIEQVVDPAPGHPQWRTVQAPFFKVVERVKAPENKEAKEPNRSFLASLLRNVQAYASDEAEVARRVKEAEDAAWKRASEHFDKTLDAMKARHNEYQRMVMEFERETNLSVTQDAWRRDDKLKGIGRRLYLLEQLESDATWLEDDLARVRQRAESVLKHVDGLRPQGHDKRGKDFPFTMPKPFNAESKGK